MATDITVALDEQTVQVFRDSLRGELLRPGDGGYDTARRVFNGMIDRKPALIVRCAGVADVVSAVNFGRTHDLLISVRGGGHNVSGKAVCEGGLMIDLSPMKGIRVDPVGQTARAQAGLTWGEFDHETQAFGLAVTGGQVSTTGIAGLTLGGGVGWLARTCGFTVDNLLSVDVVTADGQLLTASAEENQDLFWGVRGGGGNFGIVTSFEYQLHRIGPIGTSPSRRSSTYSSSSCTASCRPTWPTSRSFPLGLVASAAWFRWPSQCCGRRGPPSEHEQLGGSLSMPEISGYHHLNLTVLDPEQSAAWYTSVLGFQHMMELQGEGWRKVILMQPQSRLILGLTAHDVGSKDRFVETRTGMDHVAFQVPNRAELDAWKARFDELGVVHSPIKESAMGWLIVFRDPDNIQLEVYAHGK